MIIDVGAQISRSIWIFSISTQDILLWLPQSVGPKQCLVPSMRNGPWLAWHSWREKLEIKVLFKYLSWLSLLGLKFWCKSHFFAARRRKLILDATVIASICVKINSDAKFLRFCATWLQLDLALNKQNGFRSLWWWDPFDKILSLYQAGFFFTSL